MATRTRKADVTVTARSLAASLSKSLGRTITDKMVRSAARDRIAQYDKVSHPDYQAHAYDAATVKALTAVFAARAGRSVAQTGPRDRKAATVKATPRKATIKAATSPDVA